MNHDPELWFGPHVCDEQCDTHLGCYIAKAETGRFERIRKAKSICATCPVQQQCLDMALKNKEPFGIWGGKTERDRRNLLKKGT